MRHAVFTQDWTRLTYVHWRTDADAVRRLLPAGVVPDLLDGDAWVGLVPFAMRRVRILGTPALPHVSSFLETNVRTYTVGPDGRRGVTFLTLEADRLLPVLAARASYRLPYTFAHMSLLDSGAGGGRTLDYGSVRRWPADLTATSRVHVRVGERLEAGAVTPLDHALSARWALHSTWWGGRTVLAPIEHEPWPLHAAELLDLDAGLVAAMGLPPVEGEPRVLFSPGVSVRVGRPAPSRG